MTGEHSPVKSVAENWLPLAFITYVVLGLFGIM